MKRKLFLLLCALLTTIGVQAQPVASTPEVGQVYYLYNPITKLFMTTNVDLPFVRPSGSAWRLEAAAGYDGWITLRLKDNNTEGCGYFWGKWWANNPAQSSADYADERVFKLVNTSGENYKLQSYAWGATEAYIYINNGNSSDRSFRLACNSQDQGGLDAGYLTWQFISEADYAAYMTMDYTANIQNNDFLNGTNNWTLTGGGNKQALGNTAIEHWQAKAAEGNFDYYQDVVVPAGKYVLRAAMFNSTNSEDGASFSAPGQCGVYGTSNNVTKNANVSVDGTIYNIYTTEELLVPDGNLRLGFKNTEQMTARWFGADWIQLTCIEYCLSAVAEALPANGAMTAGKWYKYDVIFDGNYSITAATSANIIQTTDGTQMEGSATGEAVVTGDLVPLTAGTTIYYKSSSDNTLVVAAASYSYSVSEATADKAYIQPSNTVTVNFTVSTNDPSATLAQDYSGVTFDGVAINVTPGASGFTFTVPADLEAGVAHTLYIPAGAIGYAAGETYNAEQNIVLNATAVYDGVYYMRNTYFGTYISRAGNYNTQAIQDKWGLAFKVSTDANNNTKLQYFDSELWLGDDGFCYGDCSGGRVRSFNVTKVANGYKFLNTNNNLYLAVYDGQTVGDAEEGGNLLGTSNVWDLESTEAHVANYTANDNAQAAAAATAAGIEGITTKAALAAELAANYEEVDINITGAKAEKYQVYPGDGKDSGPVIYYSETVENLKPGIYKLSVAAFQRAASNERVFGAGGARGIIYLYAGDATTQLKSVSEYGSATKYADTDYVYDGKYYPNREQTGYDALATGNYQNEVYVYVADAGSGTGSLEIGIKNPTRLGGNFATWSVYNTWKLTYYSEPVVAPTALTLNETALSFNADNYSATLTATPTPAEAAPEVTWSSSDESVATVTAAGVVTGVSTGTATITATSLYDADVKATCEVTVSFTEYVGYSKSYEKNGTIYYLSNTSLIKNGSFEYPNSVACWTTGTGSANPMSASNFNIPTEGAAVGTHYLQAKASKGGADAQSINTSWALEDGKAYVFGYKTKANKECTTDLQYIGTSLSNTKGSENADKKFSTPAYGTEWSDVTYYFENTENFKYLVFNARWMANAQSFDGFYLAEVVGQESATGDTKTVVGEVTEDYTVIPSGDYPIVDISGATFDGTLTVDYSSNANGFIIATADQKTALGDVKNVVVGSTCDNLVLTDGAEAKIPAALTSATNASYDRTNTNVWGTVCLPFNVESNSFVQFYTIGEIDGTKNVLTLETTDVVEAGEPAVFKNLTAAAEIEVATSNATVTNVPGESIESTKLVGTFENIAVTENADKCYYIKENAFWQGNENFNVKAFRAYIQTNVNTSGARLTIQTDEETAINELKSLDEKQGLKDGKYLIGGKVIVVKEGKQYNVNGVVK